MKIGANAMAAMNIVVAIGPNHRMKVLDTVKAAGSTIEEVTHGNQEDGEMIIAGEMTGTMTDMIMDDTKDITTDIK